MQSKNRQPATLHLLCGKVAAGKSTLAKSLASNPGTILLQEDVWLNGLFADELKSLKDYVTYSERLKTTLAPHIVALLNSGLSVVLDFQANTLESRKWMKRLIETAECAHTLHVLDIPDEVCKARLKLRNQSGEHQFQVSDEEFDRISSYFNAPSEAEGFNLCFHSV